MIISNRIRCQKCGELIVSHNVHDFRSCKCGACSVDGGHLYLKRCGNPEDWKDESIIRNYTWENTKNKIMMASNLEDITIDEVQEVISVLERYMHSYCMYKELEIEKAEEEKNSARKGM